MKEWEKELYIYRLNPAPPKENDLQKYILNYLAQKEDKYISWFLHYYERTLNEKAIAIVQDYAMYGHFFGYKAGVRYWYGESLTRLRYFSWGSVYCV